MLLGADYIVGEVNRLLCDWAGYFRYGTRRGGSLRSGITR